MGSGSHQNSNPLKMKTSLPSLRINPRNPNHHLFRNNGRIWWLHYTLHCPDYTVQRVRSSLGTSCLAIARERRDAALAHLKIQARLGQPTPALGFPKQRRIA
jgi:hypothetical protein